MEKRTLYEDDLTEERGPSPVEREDVAHDLTLDPDEPSPEDDDGDGDDADDDDDDDDESVD